MPKAKPVVLSVPDREFFKKRGGEKWMGGQLFRAGPKKRFHTALETFADRLAELGLEPHDPQTLRELLAVVLSKDGTFSAWFRDHNSDVSDVDVFVRLCDVAAGAIVEDYVHKASPKAPKASLLIDEELQGKIATLIEIAVEQGEISAAAGRKAGEGWWQAGHDVDLIEAARAQLEALLSSETHVLHDAGDGLEIPQAERDREVAKSALMQLQIKAMRELAQDAELAPLRDPEALAELIVRKYNADGPTIAELVLRYSKPDVERGYATRLVPLSETIDLDVARAAVSDLQGRYLRVGVAAWVIFKQTRGADGRLSVSADMRYYAVRPQREGDDHEIAAVKRTHPIDLHVRHGSAWAEVEGRSTTDMRRLRGVLRSATGIRPALALNPGVPAREGEVAGWDAHTVRMLHLLEVGLRDAHIDYENFSHAHFSSAGIQDADPQRPSIIGIQLQGQHVLADPTACRLVTQGQTLAAVDVRVRWREDLQGTAFYTTVRIGLAADHAFVLTAYADDNKRARRLHLELVRRMRRELGQALPDTTTLTAMITKITARAIEVGPPEVVDILGPTVAPDGECVTTDATGSDAAPSDLRSAG
jgi:hypothetical protein